MIECGRTVLESTALALSLPPMQFQPIFEVFDTILIYLNLLFLKTMLYMQILTGIISDDAGVTNMSNDKLRIIQESHFSVLTIRISVWPSVWASK